MYEFPNFLNELKRIRNPQFTGAIYDFLYDDNCIVIFSHKNKVKFYV